MRVLLTRPVGKGDELKVQITDMVECVIQQPMITISAAPELHELSAWCQLPVDIFIFISTSAVAFLRQALLNNPKASHQLWQGCQCLAIGSKTEEALRNWLNLPVQKPYLETTEGLLDLTMLQTSTVMGKKVVIVRGNGGRELLKEQLISRGARVDYWPVYQRQPIIGDGNLWWQQWQAAQLDTIVVTSVEIAQVLLRALPSVARSWLQALRWIAASPRIANYLLQWGIPSGQISVASGANDRAIVKQIKTILEE